MILISNIYYMLAYAFRSLKTGDIKDFGSESFENLHELFAEIIIKSMRKQLKRGLPKAYASKNEELCNLRGKIDFQQSVRKLTLLQHRLMCEFDEFTEDTENNRLIKCAITNLLRQEDVSAERKKTLKFIHLSLNGVTDISYRKIPPQRTGETEYTMLVNICRFLLDGLIMSTSGGSIMRKCLKDESMCSLYERFLLEYFRLHHAKLNARSTWIDWNMVDIPFNMPRMKSDVLLSNGDKTLILDAKFYTHTMSENFGKKIYHSHNLYQIYTYVKNYDVSGTGNVLGMLLYAKTDEDITPDSDNVIGGNQISIKTLDLSKQFSEIQSQLEKIAALIA